MNRNKINVIYFGDPMCSTCYGFSPELSKVLDSLGGELDFQLVMGGLRPFNTETMKELSCFLKREWHRVAEISGQYFNHEILEDHSFIYDTEPSCRAVTTMRRMAPEHTFNFFQAIQKSFYAENKNINNTEVITEIAGGFGVNQEQFRELFESEASFRDSKNDFSYTSEIGIKKFPTVAIRKGEQIVIVSEGYMKAGLLIEKLKQSALPNFQQVNRKG